MICHKCKNEGEPYTRDNSCESCYNDIPKIDIWCGDCSDSLKICRRCQEPEHKWRNKYVLEGETWEYDWYEGSCHMFKPDNRGNDELGPGYLTDEILGPFEGKRVRITVEVIE